MKARPTQSRKGVKGGLRPFSSAPCRVKGQRPLWGLGQRPNSSTGDQYAKRAQQRCRQRSVPAPNFARPQTRPQAALPPRFRDEPQLLGIPITKKPCRIHDRAFCALITPCQRSPAHPQSCGRPSPSPQRGQASGTDGGQSDPDVPQSTCGCSRSSPDECRSRC